MFDDAKPMKEDYENRIIFLTDACPNVGRTDANSLLGMVQNSAMQKKLYTTFVGVGLDFNAALISEITKVRGANYFAVHSSDDFFKKLNAEFDYFVFPMVFDLKLSLQSEGGQVCISDVFGSNEIDVKSGEVMNIKTLFPSPPDPDNGRIKGGIVLIKLMKRNKNLYNDLVIECSFVDKAGKEYQNKQSVVLKESK